ncbi:hypothetical protein G7054_g5290 [Neopestalotiopsis clavispora]|nr:hypothetical protein G7054_g5290 [Neopestalotiopsis clavispora]
MTTTIFPKPEQAPTLPGLQLDRVSNQAPQSPRHLHMAAATTPSPTSSPVTQKPGKQYRTMNQQEWVQFCHGVGVMKDNESTTVIRPTAWYWPPRGFPDGLYQDVLWEKAKFTYSFHIIATIVWILMVVQLALNAVLTAVGSSSSQDSVVITTIAGVNTLVSGILALMHNSGLPDRYRSNRNEFGKIEDYLKEIVDTRLVPVDDSIVEVMAHCFDKFASARQSVQDNVPASYVPAAQKNASSSKGSPVASKPAATDVKH